MMKTLADLTASYVATLATIRSDPSVLRQKYVLSTTQIYASDTWRVIADDAGVKYAAEQLIDAARTYTGGRSVDIVTMRGPDGEARDFEIFRSSLRVFVNALEGAAPAGEAKLLGGSVDATQVPTPTV